MFCGRGGRWPGAGAPATVARGCPAVWLQAISTQSAHNAHMVRQRFMLAPSGRQGLPRGDKIQGETIVAVPQTGWLA